MDALKGHPFFIFYNALSFMENRLITETISPFLFYHYFNLIYFYYVSIAFIFITLFVFNA